MATSIINTRWRFATELWVWNMTQVTIGESILDGEDSPTLIITTPDGYVITYNPNTIDVFSANAVINMADDDQGLPFAINQFYVDEELPSGIMKDSEGNDVETIPWTEFPDGIYKVQFSFTTSVGDYEEVTEYALLTFTVRTCIAARVKAAMDSKCSGCHNTTDSDLCLMTALLRTVELYFETGKFEDAKNALERLSKICTSGNYCC
jgi:hypothetical protein